MIMSVSVIWFYVNFLITFRTIGLSEFFDTETAISPRLQFILTLIPINSFKYHLKIIVEV